MKEILLKVLGEEDAVDRLVYSELLIAIAESPMRPKEGMSNEEIYETGKLIRAIREAVSTDCESLVLEDSDYSLLKSKFDNMKWKRYSEHLENFITDFKEAKSFKASSVKDKEEVQ